VRGLCLIRLVTDGDDFPSPRRDHQDFLSSLRDLHLDGRALPPPANIVRFPPSLELGRYALFPLRTVSLLWSDDFLFSADQSRQGFSGPFQLYYVHPFPCFKAEAEISHQPLSATHRPAASPSFLTAGSTFFFFLVRRVSSLELFPLAGTFFRLRRAEYPPIASSRRKKDGPCIIQEA